MTRSPSRQTGAGYDKQFDCISSNPPNDDRIETFDEGIGTLLGNIAFQTNSFPLNPGSSLVFPRLSKIAQLYDKYRFELLEFYFQHDVSQFNPQGSAGLVLLSCLFDAASPAPTLKTQIEATRPHVICMPNQNSLLRVPMNRLHPLGYPLFVRPGVLPGGTDVKTYDAGNFFATVQGMLANATEVGELHVRGRVRLIDEILDSSPVAAPLNNQVVVVQATAGEALTTGIDHQMLFAGTQIGSIGIVNTGGSLQLPAGNFLIDVDAKCAFTGLSTQFSLALTKGGPSIQSSSPVLTYTSGALTTASLHESVFLSSDGTAASAITAVVNAIFTTGTATAVAFLRVVAI